jgi:hypothetical protein
MIQQSKRKVVHSLNPPGHPFSGFIECEVRKRAFFFVESCFATSRLDRHHDKRYDSQQWYKEEIALLVLDPANNISF